jgi:hypothetical protein
MFRFSETIKENKNTNLARKNEDGFVLSIFSSK